MYGELVFEVVIFVVAVFLYVVSMRMKVINPISVMRPNWWPQIILGIMMIVDAILIYGSVVNVKKKDTKEECMAFAVWGWLVAEVANVAVFIILQGLVGFLLSSFIFASVSSFIIDGGFRKVHPIISVAIAFAITVFFGSLLGLPLPRGEGMLREFSYLLY